MQIANIVYWGIHAVVHICIIVFGALLIVSLGNSMFVGLVLGLGIPFLLLSITGAAVVGCYGYKALKIESQEAYQSLE